ncbi:ENV1 protein, partial [Nothoprocta ornata]|nr:ENV1 protein [Nothoprocta pentlandii]NWY08441.1 ENV1 protein [Nothoprocta ornata]
TLRPTDPLLTLASAAFHILNASYPNLTEHCWLCFDIRPPFYEAIGISKKPVKSNGTNPPQCDWKETNKPGITLNSVSGKGYCIG